MAYYIFRLASWFCPLLPDRFGYWLFARFGDLAFWFARSQHNGYIDNLRHVLGSYVPQRDLERVARRGMQNIGKNYFDLFRTHALSRERILAQLAGVEGLEHLEQALSEGKGVIAGSAHFGSWDMILQLAAIRLNAEIYVPNERLKPEKLFQYIVSLRSSQGIHIVPVDTGARTMLKALKAGHMLGIAYDRDITRTGPMVNFFNSPAQIPDGAVQLALKYNVPVIIGFSVRQPDNRSYVYVEPPIELTKTGNTDSDICAGVEKIAAVLEKYICRYPDQWLVRQKFWTNGVKAKG